MKNYTVKIDTNLVKIPVENMEGVHLGDVYVNPSDVNLIPRADKARKEIEKLIEESIDKVKDNMIFTDEQGLALLSDIDTKIKEWVNYLFDYDVSSVVFGNQHCLNTVKGELFVGRLIDAFMPVFEEIRAEEEKASENKIKKYTDQIQ